MDELARDLNFSTKTLYNYLNFLRTKDLIYNHSNNLVFRSIRPFLGRIKTVIYLDDSFTLFDVSCVLYAKILEQKGRRIAFKESVKRAGVGDGCKRGFGENLFRPSLSFRTIAKLLNISKNKAFRVIENLNRLGIIKTIKQKPQMIKDNVPGLMFYIEDLPGYRFEIGNRLFEVFGCKHDFLQYPVYLKNITLKQYLENID
jgi:predicted transcriptional regulator